MYLLGHIEIINDVLSNNIFDNFFKNKGNKFSKINLIKGLQYVDFPCGKYKIKDNKIIFQSRQICKLNNLFKLYLDKTQSESQIYQQHKGFFSHLHSMSTDPNNNMLKIRNRILISVLGYSLLALYDDNIFDENPKIQLNTIWIGMIMHIITDSYSPAHTIRDKNAHFYHIKSNNNDDDDKKIRLKVHEIIKLLARQENILYKNSSIFIKSILSEIKKEEEEKEYTIDYIKNQKSQLYNIYKSFKFEYDTNRLVRKKEKSVDNTIGELGHEKNGDIIAFQYYEGQPLGLHSKLDFLSYVKNNKQLYKRMVDECTEYLILYKNVVETGDVSLFLHKVLELLLEKTFHINNKYLQDKTDKIYYENNSNAVKILKKNISDVNINGIIKSMQQKIKII